MGHLRLIGRIAGVCCGAIYQGRVQTTTASAPTGVSAPGFSSRIRTRDENLQNSNNGSVFVSEGGWVRFGEQPRSCFSERQSRGLEPAADSSGKLRIAVVYGVGVGESQRQGESPEPVPGTRADPGLTLSRGQAELQGSWQACRAALCVFLSGSARAGIVAPNFWKVQKIRP